MKVIQITKYEADDGRIFDNAQVCIDYEANDCRVARHYMRDSCTVVDLSKKPDLRFYFQGDGSWYWADDKFYYPEFRNSGQRPKWATHLVYFGK